MLSALYAIARLSVRPSVRRVDQSKLIAFLLVRHQMDTTSSKPPIIMLPTGRYLVLKTDCIMFFIAHDCKTLHCGDCNAVIGRLSGFSFHGGDTLQRSRWHLGSAHIDVSSFILLI